MAGRDLQFTMNVDAAALLQVNPKEFYTKALLANRSSANFRQVLNIKEKTKIGRLSFGTLLFPADCTYQGGDSTLGAKEMDVCKVQLGTDVCMYELETSFLADWMKSGSNGEWMPGDFATFFYDEIGRNVSDMLEILTWQGDTSITFDSEDPTTYLGICDGLWVKLCDADIPTNQALQPSPESITAGAVTAATVINEMTRMYNEIPTVIKQDKASVLWYVSQNIADAYQLAVAVQSAEVYTRQDPEMKFLGYTLTVGTGMADNTMCISRADNYVYLADMVSDPEDLQVIDLSKTIGDKTIRVRSDFKIGFDFLNQEEWVVFNLDCTS